MDVRRDHKGGTPSPELTMLQEVKFLKINLFFLHFLILLFPRKFYFLLSKRYSSYLLFFFYSYFMIFSGDLSSTLVPLYCVKTIQDIVSICKTYNILYQFFLGPIMGSTNSILEQQIPCCSQNYPIAYNDSQFAEYELHKEKLGLTNKQL